MKNRITKKQGARLLAAAALLLALTGCSNVLFPHAKQAVWVSRPRITSEERQFRTPGPGDTVAVIETSAGRFAAVLYPDKAPQACANFIGLAQQGYYNGLTFYRTEAGFVIEAGQDADGGSTTIWNGSGYAAEISDELHHYSGALCAPLGDTGKAASVFYVVTTLPDALDSALVTMMQEQSWRQPVIEAYQAGGGAPYLDYTDTVFGQVYDGMRTADAIAQAQTDENARPLEEITIRSIEIRVLDEKGH